MPEPIKFPEPAASLSQDIEQRQLGDDSPTVYDALILGTKVAAMQLNNALNADRAVIRDTDEAAKRLATSDTLPALYRSLVDALVLWHRAKNEGKL